MLSFNNIFVTRERESSPDSNRQISSTVNTSEGAPDEPKKEIEHVAVNTDLHGT